MSAENEQQLNYKIVTTAELAGAQAWADNLEKQIGKAKAAKQDYSALAKELQVVKTSIAEASVAQTASTAATDADTASTEANTLSKRELLESLRMLNMEFPLLADAERALFNPMVAEVFAAVAAVVALGKAFKDAYVDMQGVQMPDLTSGIDDANNLATAWDGIHLAITKANQEWSSAESIYGRALKSIESQLALTKQLIDAETKLALQRLENQKAAGQISEADYIAQKAALEGKSQKAEQDAELHALQEQLTQKQNEVANAKAQLAAAQKHADSYHLPETDEQAKAQSEAFRKEGDAYKQSAASRKNSADEISDAAQTANQPGLAGAASIFTSGFWRDIGTRITSLWTGSRPTFGDAETYARQQREQAGSEKAIADQADRRAAEEDEKIRQRDQAREEVANAAGNYTKAQNESAWDSNPNNVGSLAYRIALEKQIQAINDQAEAIKANSEENIALHKATIAALTKHTAQLKTLNQQVARATDYGTGAN